MAGDSYHRWAFIADPAIKKIDLNDLDNFLLYQFRVLKKWCDRLRLGPGARVERAGSIGWVAPWLRRSKLDSAGEGGGALPRPRREEISAL